MGDGVRRPARCMRPGSRPIRGISEAGRWVRYLPASPSRAMPAPGPSGSSLPIMLRPGFPVPGIPEVVSPPVHAAVRAMARLRPTGAREPRCLPGASAGPRRIAVMAARRRVARIFKNRNIGYRNYCLDDCQVTASGARCDPRAARMTQWDVGVRDQAQRTRRPCEPLRLVINAVADSHGTNR